MEVYIYPSLALAVVSLEPEKKHIPLHSPTSHLHHHPQHHTPEHFPFLAVPANARHRTAFHATLARLILSVVDETQASFDAFMEPILQVQRW